jgi:hypothetical protein
MPAVLAANLTEFNDAIELINSINAHEREFYDFVCRSFDKLRPTRRQWRGGQSRRSRMLKAAPAMDGNRGSSGARGPHGLVIAERAG